MMMKRFLALGVIGFSTLSFASARAADPAGTEASKPVAQQPIGLQATKPILAKEGDDELKKLTITRHNLLLEAFKDTEGLMKSGQWTINTLDTALSTVEKLATIAVELAETTEDRILVRQRQVESASAIVKILDMRLKLGLVTRQEFNLGKDSEIAAKIELLKAKRAAEKKVQIESQKTYRQIIQLNMTLLQSSHFNVHTFYNLMQLIENNKNLSLLLAETAEGQLKVQEEALRMLLKINTLVEPQQKQGNLTEQD
ncbi:MAG: hypothetical protein ACRCZF_23135, partial [Gemmataceae bacterium]